MGHLVRNGHPWESRRLVMGQRQDVGRNNDTVESIYKVVSLSRDAYCQCLGSGNSTLAIKLLV